MSTTQQPQYRDPFPWASACTIFHLPFRGQRVPVRLHPYLLVFWGLSLLSSIMYGGVYIGFRTMIDVVILFFTVFCHELGHSWAAIGYSGTCHSITLWPLGGFAEVSHSKGPKEDLWVCFAGPLTHIPMCGFWYLLLWACAPSGFGIAGVPGCNIYISQYCFWTAVIAQAGILNIGLFLFNLFLPAYPLDASRILLNFLGICKVPITRAAYIVCGVSLPLGLGLVAYGIYGWIKEAPVYSVTLFIGIFSLFATWGVYKAAKNGQVGMHPAFSHYERESEPSGIAPTSGGWGRASGYQGFHDNPPSAFPAPGLPSTHRPPDSQGHKLGGTSTVPPYKQQNSSRV